MTDHPDPLDELASAHLDGELSADELAPTSESELRARVERLMLARDALQGTDLSIDPQEREGAVAAALAAFDDERGASTSVVDARGSVVDFAEEAGRRRGRRMLRVTGVAAAVAVLALAVPFLGRLDSGSNDEQIAGPPEAPADLSMRTDDASAGARSEALAAAPAPGLEHLGPFVDVAGLTDAVRARMGSGSAGPAPTEGGGSAGADAAGPAEPCLDERADYEPVTFVALADLDGRAVLVLVREDEPSGPTLIALDVSSCLVVVTEEM